MATHAQIGLAVWSVDAPLEDPIETHRASDAQAGARAVMALDDGQRAVLAGGATAYIYDGSSVQPIAGSDDGATIVSVVHIDDTRFGLVREDGTIDLHDAQSLDRLDRIRRASRVTSAATIECLGAHRLLLAGDEGPVQMVGVDDEAITVLGSTITGWRDVAAENGRIAAVTGDRQRVILWNAWEPAKPVAEVHIAAIVRHRVADVAFG
ncbi:MAG: hypothetical protein QM770_18360 [Tepidisphaeraceae bacterium]